MLKTLWLLDGALLLVALVMAFTATGQDAAGRGILWSVPLVMALGLGGSWLLERTGAHKPAVALGLVAPLIGVIVVASLGRSLFAVRRERAGASHWADATVQQLARAISEGDTARIRAAAARTDVNAVGSDGTTPLTFAISQGPAIVSLLLELGANPNLRTPGVMSPLEQALEASNGAFDALLRGGADANAVDDYGTPVLFASIRSDRPDRFDALLSHGADVKRLDANGRSALMAAVESQRWKVARTLLDRGVDASIVATDGTTLTMILERVTRNAPTDPEYTSFAARLAASGGGTR